MTRSSIAPALITVALFLGCRPHPSGPHTTMTLADPDGHVLCTFASVDVTPRPPAGYLLHVSGLDKGKLQAFSETHLGVPLTITLTGYVHSSVSFRSPIVDGEFVYDPGSK